MKSYYIPEHTETITKVIPGEVVLSLTIEEAMHLRKICDSVGGDPKGPRGNFDSMRHKLGEIITQSDYDKFLETCPPYIEGYKSIYFK